MGVESTGTEKVVALHGPQKKNTQAVLDSFRDIVVSVCIIILTGCYIIELEMPMLLDLTVQHHFFCVFLPMS